jgi:hypothetical protein
VILRSGWIFNSNCRSIISTLAWSACLSPSLLS